MVPAIRNFAGQSKSVKFSVEREAETTGPA
jgi:hypothetical protein